MRLTEAQQVRAIRLLKDAHRTIDMLFAMRIQRSPRVRTYLPSQSGIPWTTLRAIHAFNNEVQEDERGLQ